MKTSISSKPVLEIRDLSVEFRTLEGTVQAVDHVSLSVNASETLAIVGESGSGKSVTAMSVLGLIPQPPGRIASGQVLFGGRDLLKASKSVLRNIRGNSIAMVFQDPMTSLNPVLTVGRQLSEALRTHRSLNSDEARRRAIELLDAVGVPDATTRFRQYPHQFSGGMRQRVLIAMSVANHPKVIIADEPTTALDVTIQAQVFETLRKVQVESQAAMVLITHDLGLVAEIADRVAVMYAGRIVETADVFEIFERPLHPYTRGLLHSRPRIKARRQRLQPIQGTPPVLAGELFGCPFFPRCALARGRARCQSERPQLIRTGTTRSAACHFAHELSDDADAPIHEGAQ